MDINSTPVGSIVIFTVTCGDNETETFNTIDDAMKDVRVLLESGFQEIIIKAINA